MEGRSPVMSVLVSLRPGQWTKNFIVFAALIFARRLLDPAAVALALAAFLIFCALSGAVYLFNDVSDLLGGSATPAEIGGGRSRPARSRSARRWRGPRSS